MVTTVFVILVFLAVIMIAVVLSAPWGWEDREGFHEGKRPRREN